MGKIRFPRLTSTSEELLHLDLLRFIASSGIVFLHSRVFFFPLAERAQFTSPRREGLALFVDLFFVISGFIIAYIYSGKVTNHIGYGGFLKRRIARLIPLHWLTFVISILIFWSATAVAHVHVNNLPSFHATCLADAFFLLHGIVTCGNNNFFNGQSWSISAEFLMYISFPVFALVASWRRWLPAIIAMLLLVVIGIYHYRAGSAVYFDWEHLYPPLRALPSFLIGVSFFHYRLDIKNIRMAKSLLLLTLVILVAAMLGNTPPFAILLFVYLCAMFAIAADMQGTTWRLVKKIAPLGQLTYSIYMWHGIFIILIMNAIGDRILHASRAPMLILAAICYGLILLVSYFSYFYVETPARRWINQIAAVARLPSTPG